jgi:hypothetical protein
MHQINVMKCTTALVKCKAVQIYAMKPYRGVDVWLNSFLTLALDGGVVNFVPWLLRPQGKRPQSTLNRRLGGLQSWSGHFGEEKNILSLPGIEPWTI